MQAYEQSGVITNGETSLMLKLSPGSADNFRREWEEKQRRMLPTHGSIHDTAAGSAIDADVRIKHLG